MDNYVSVEEAGSNVTVTGFNKGDNGTISCANGYIKNTDLSEVSVTCSNSSTWIGQWGLHFNNNITNSSFVNSHEILKSSRLPKCYMTEPAFDSLTSCQNGCEVGACNSVNQSNSYRCACGEEHSGFHCTANKSIFSNRHVAAITIPLIIIIFALGAWWYKRSRSDFAATALINEDADDSFSKHESKLPWETDETKPTNSYFPSLNKHNDGSTLVRTTFKPVNLFYFC